MKHSCLYIVYFIHRNGELLLVNFRRFAKTTDLSHKLKRGITDLLVSDRRIKIEQCLNVSTHSLQPHLSIQADCFELFVRDNSRPVLWRNLLSRSETVQFQYKK